MKTALNWHVKEDPKPSLFDIHIKNMNMNDEVYLKFCQEHGFTKKNSKKTNKDFQKELMTLKSENLKNSLVQRKNKKINLSKNTYKIKQIPFLNEKLKTYDHPEDFLSFIKDIADKVNLNFLIKDERVFSYFDVLYRIFENKNEWVRTTDLKKIKSKNGERALNYLIKHFFAEYQDFNHPAFIKSWYKPGKTYIFHLEISKGESVVKSFRRNFSEDLTKKEILSLKDYPSNFSYKDMVLKTYVARYKGGDKLFRALRFYGGDLSSQRFKGFINFMAKNEDFLDFSQVRPLWDYAQNQGIVSFKGRTLDNFLEGMENWHQDLAKNVNVKYEDWEGSGLGGYEEIRNEDNIETLYKIEEILNSVDLKREGKEMRHCVYSYVSRCRGGGTSIWTMKKVNEISKNNLLTIEIRGQDIVQVRGKCNRMAKDVEKKLIRAWAKKEGLKINLGSF